jgi:hypothetical protein
MLPWVKKNMASIKAVADHQYSDKLKYVKYGVFKEAKSLLVLNTEIENDGLTLGELIFIIDLTKIKNVMIENNKGFDFEINDTQDNAEFKEKHQNTDTKLNGILLKINNKHMIYLSELSENYWFLVITLILLTFAMLILINRNAPYKILILSNRINMKAPFIGRLIKDLDDVSQNDLVEYLQILHSNCKTIRSNKHLN